PHEIKDPFRQVVGSKSALIRKLKSRLQWGNEWVPCCHAVIFPDIERQAVAQASLPPHAEKQIILTSEDLDQLEARFRNVHRFWKERQIISDLKGNALFEDLRNLLVPDTLLSQRQHTGLGNKETELPRTEGIGDLQERIANLTRTEDDLKRK